MRPRPNSGRCIRAIRPAAYPIRIVDAASDSEYGSTAQKRYRTPIWLSTRYSRLDCPRVINTRKVINRLACLLNFFSEPLFLAGARSLRPIWLKKTLYTSLPHPHPAHPPLHFPPLDLPEVRAIMGAPRSTPLVPVRPPPRDSPSTTHTRDCHCESKACHPVAAASA
jgi:hypothetical protein